MLDELIRRLKYEKKKYEHFAHLLERWNDVANVACPTCPSNLTSAVCYIGYATTIQHTPSD
jgi:hypothetical protein